MTDLEDFSESFLVGWLKTLLKSMEKNLDKETRLKIFKDTGIYCAQTHTTEVLKKIKLKSKDIMELITILNDPINGIKWELLNEHEIKVEYERCFCPIAQYKLLNSEILCDCSTGWLKYNLEIFFNKVVKVTLQQSVLRGDPKCSFIVKF